MNNGLGGIGITELTADYPRNFICQPYKGVSTFSVADSTWVPFTTNGLGTDFVSTITIHDSMIVAGAFDGIRALRPPYEQWTPENTGLSASNTINLETYHDLLFASAYPRNFYVARSSSLEWHDRSDNLPEFTFIWDIFCDGSHVYAGTNRSLWKRTLGDMNPGIREKKNLHRLLCYPNPCQNKVSVDTRHLTGDVLNITLYDIYGKTILDQILGGMQKGGQSFDLSTVPSGLYFIHIQTREENYTAKILKQ